MPVKTIVKVEKRKLSANQFHAELHDNVDFQADEKCSIVFKNGIELLLDVGITSSVAFAKKDTYPFDVQYNNRTVPSGDIIVP